MSEELWREAVGLEGRYAISNAGRVYSHLTDKYITQQITAKGYHRVNLCCVSGKTKSRSVHSMVLDAFVGLRPKGFVTRHLNGDKLDNRAKNLVWGTAKENYLDKVTHGTALFGEAHGKSKLTLHAVKDIRNNHKRGYSDQFAKKYNVSQQTIRDVVRRITWRHVVQQEAG